jgi:hypothetical protein
VKKECEKRKQSLINFEKQDIPQYFEKCRMKNRTNFVSAKLLTINSKLRDFSVQMLKLRDLLGKIINKVSCIKK